jgi:hypothetical protein
MFSAVASYLFGMSAFSAMWSPRTTSSSWGLDLEHRPMLERILADTLLALHLAFILFAVGGSFLALRWPRLVWIHLPAAAWAALIALAGGLCPLTEWENALRRAAGMAGYPEGFIGSLLIPLIYPGGLTRSLQIGLGGLVLLLNAVGYGLLMRQRRAKRRFP